MILTRAYGQKRSFREFPPQWYASVEQLHNSQTQLSLRALQKNTVVEILYTSEIIDPTEKVSTFRVPRLHHLLYLETMILLYFPTGSSKVSDMSAITLPSL